MTNSPRLPRVRLLILALLIAAVGVPTAASAAVPHDAEALYALLPADDARDARAVDAPTVVEAFTGEASWYGPGFHGRLTANGETFDQRDLTAAHRTLPFDTEVRVTNLDTGEEVTVRINDRGPYHGDRVIDLSQAAAEEISMDGVAEVRVEVLAA